MMGERRVDQAALLYEFSLDRHIPAHHMLRSMDRFVDLEGLRAKLATYYSPIGRLSIDPELLLRMLLVGSAGLEFPREVAGILGVIPATIPAAVPSVVGAVLAVASPCAAGRFTALQLANPPQWVCHDVVPRAPELTTHCTSYPAGSELDDILPVGCRTRSSTNRIARPNSRSEMGLSEESSRGPRRSVRQRPWQAGLG